MSEALSMSEGLQICNPCASWLHGGADGLRSTFTHADRIADCLLAEGPVLEKLVKDVMGQRTEQNLEVARYSLQPTESDVPLAEMNRRCVHAHKKQMDFRHGHEQVWEWWKKEGTMRSRVSDEPVGLSGERMRLRLLEGLPCGQRYWLYKRMEELV